MEYNQTQALHSHCSSDQEDDEADSNGNLVAFLDVPTNKHTAAARFQLHLGENVIGRDAACDVCIKCQTLSKQHAVIEISPGSYVIYDLGSLNKTKKDKSVLKPKVRYSLQNDDKICLADIECKFIVQENAIQNADDSESDTGSESVLFLQNPSNASDVKIQEKKSDDEPDPASDSGGMSEQNSLMEADTQLQNTEFDNMSQSRESVGSNADFGGDGDLEGESNSVIPETPANCKTEKKTLPENGEGEPSTRDELNVLSDSSESEDGHIPSAKDTSKDEGEKVKELMRNPTDLYMPSSDSESNSITLQSNNKKTTGEEKYSSNEFEMSPGDDLGTENEFCRTTSKEKSISSDNEVEEVEKDSRKDDDSDKESNEKLDPENTDKDIEETVKKQLPDKAVDDDDDEDDDEFKESVLDMLRIPLAVSQENKVADESDAVVSKAEEEKVSEEKIDATPTRRTSSRQRKKATPVKESVPKESRRRPVLKEKRLPLRKKCEDEMHQEDDVAREEEEMESEHAIDENKEDSAENKSDDLDESRDEQSSRRRKRPNKRLSQRLEESSVKSGDEDTEEKATPLKNRRISAENDDDPSDVLPTETDSVQSTRSNRRATKRKSPSATDSGTERTPLRTRRTLKTASPVNEKESELKDDEEITKKKSEDSTEAEEFSSPLNKENEKPAASLVNDRLTATSNETALSKVQEMIIENVKFRFSDDDEDYGDKMDEIRFQLKSKAVVQLYDCSLPENKVQVEEELHKLNEESKRRTLLKKRSDRRRRKSVPQRRRRVSKKQNEADKTPKVKRVFGPIEMKDDGSPVRQKTPVRSTPKRKTVNATPVKLPTRSRGRSRSANVEMEVEESSDDLEASRTKPTSPLRQSTRRFMSVTIEKLSASVTKERSRKSTRSVVKNSESEEGDDEPEFSPAPKKRRSVKSSAKSRSRGRSSSQASSVHSDDSNSSEPEMVNVLFTRAYVPKASAALVHSLGGSVVDSISQCTHIITDQMVRTVKLMCAVARGIPIVRFDWLTKSKKAGTFLNPNNYILKDDEIEEQYEFKLGPSLKKAKKSRLLDGYKIHVTRQVQPGPSEMKLIIESAGGQYLSRLPMKYEDDKTVVISCKEDLCVCARAVKCNIPVVDREFIMTGILRQELNVTDYVLIH